MRRVSLALVSGVLFSLVFPSSAHAWWGWIDELSGAGRFRGWEVEARLYCFGATDGDPAAAFVELAAEQVASAYELTMNMAGTLKGKNQKAEAVFETFVEPFAALRRGSHSATISRISPSRAASLKEEVTTIKERVEGVCGGFDCTSDQRATLDRVAASLAETDRALTNAEVLARERNRLQASAGVSFSACPMQKDLTRRGAIGLTFRKMDTYGDRKEEFAGGNTISLSTLTPMASWRPLFEVASGKYDFVDLASGAGVYWLASDGDLPGGFDAFSGLILEPLRIDLHAPSLSYRTGFKWGLLASASFRYGLAIFPAGFAPNAFGTTRRPEQSQRIRGEWVDYWAFYLDVGRLIYYSSRGNR